MRDIRPAAFDEFVHWYLAREWRKRGEPPLSRDAHGSALSIMRRIHPGKLRQWFDAAEWRLVEFTAIEEILRLVCVDSMIMRRNLLVRDEPATDRRLLGNVIANARSFHYFDNAAVAQSDPMEYAWRQSRIDQYRRAWPRFGGEERIAACSLNMEERVENGAANYYLHDGFGRMLAFAYLVWFEGRPFVPVEALLALER
jgi:hypothetical protein